MPPKRKVIPMKTHRVGSCTFGIMLLAAGVMMLIHVFVPDLSYDIILRFWPVALILLGVEVLIANLRSQKTKFIYDVPAVFMMLMVLVFTAGMAWAEFALDYSIAHMHM